MLRAEKEKHIKEIFTKKEIFEKYVLDVVSDDDRVEIIGILSKTIIRYALKDELSFLYMKDLTHFKFSLVTNLLFREMSHEWISYANEHLGYNSEEASLLLQEKEKAIFLISLVKEYFRHYKVYFVQEIADTFIELVETMPSPEQSNPLIDSVLKSDFIKNGKILVVYNYGQLWSRVRHAHDFKKDKLTKIQIKIDEATTVVLQKKYEYQEAILEEKPLAYYDEAILRLRDTMVQYMMRIDSFSIKKKMGMISPQILK